DATFLGVDYTSSAFDLYPVSEHGTFPILLPDGKFIVEGEVYRITHKELDSIDRLEGYPSFYRRTVIQTLKNRLCYVYYWPKRVTHKSQEHIRLDGNVKSWEGPQ